MILGATLLTDRKVTFPVSLEYLTKEPLIDRIYINIETEDFNYPRWKDLEAYLKDSAKPFDIDFLTVHSSWASRPQYDQDPARFMPIARARNMALDWAIVWTMMRPDISHLLFVDSDVRPHAGGLQHLLNINKPLVGGLVPGRGAHSKVKYVFGTRNQERNIITCQHGTSGYLLIARSIFEVQRFRSGPDITKRGTYLCDDPAYASDAFHHQLADAWYIDTRATADHIDDPEHPLTIEEAINDYNNP